MLRLVRTDTAKTPEPTSGNEQNTFQMGRIRPLPDDIFSIRRVASFCEGQEARVCAAHSLCDIDSFAFVLANSNHSDSRSIAERGLRHRMDSFSDEILKHLAQVSDSEAIRSCAASLLEKRK